MCWSRKVEKCLVDERERMYVNWLYHVDGIGRKRTQDIFRTGRSAEWLYFAGRTEVKELFEEQMRLGRALAETLTENIWRAREHSPELLYTAMKKRGIQMLMMDDPDYPMRLKEIPDAPVLLYSIGEKRWCEKEFLPTVAIVGARQCSEYGKYIARELGRKCAERPVRVVSGMACGIDAAAQYAACEADGVVAAVLGSGADVCYPDESRYLYEELRRNGTIYSEYVPGAKPRAQNFPPRNRIISGMADVLVVVEARERSGTLITVDMALEQGRDVYVVPGRLTDSLSRGCNRLIGQGAEVLCDIDDMLDTVICRGGCTLRGRKEGERETRGEERRNPYECGEMKYAVYEALDVELTSVQMIYDRLREKEEMDVATLQSILFFMQVDGTVVEREGRFCVKMP